MSTPESVRVLLVEPHADTREMYVVGLTYRGFRVFTARDESSATAAFATHAPSIVVSDTRLPHGGEVGLLRGFADAGVPVIALTCLPPEQHSALRAANLRALLMKPCQPDMLAEAIALVLARRQRPADT